MLRPMTDEAELARRRTAMGKGVMGYVTEPHMHGQVGDRWWTCIAGSSTPDLNMALVHDANPALLDEPLAQFAQRRLPSLVMLAGRGKEVSGALPSSYAKVGELPVMEADLATLPCARDPRVRQATADDVETVTELLHQAYGFGREDAALATGPLTSPRDGIAIYLLEQDGTPVSTVTLCRADDTASVWSMATPEQHGRRGYGRALLADVLHRAHDDGATLGLLGATPAGLPLYEATGWVTAETWDLWTDAVSEQFTS
jgi:GNAT superfamily N-acetyltransferase